MKIISNLANTDTLTLVLFTASVVLVAALYDNYSIQITVKIVKRNKK